MKLSNILLPIGFIALLNVPAPAQTGGIVGSWQLVKQTTCLEQVANDGDDTSESLRDEMHGQSSATPQLVSFKANSSGEESTRILNSGKVANPKKFYYKLNGEMLLILDKKSQTITNSYRVEKFTADSLIVSNVSRPCETRVFVKISK
ncbi:MAG: hypothetical protein M3Y60_01710 [Bacteroidota bacterium]|nr:hypothetical protein [Bacteroidota bacterium]